MSIESTARLLRDIGRAAQERGNELSARADHLKDAAKAVNEIRMWVLWDLAEVLRAGTDGWFKDDGW